MKNKEKVGFKSPLSDKSDDGFTAIAFLFKKYSAHNNNI